MPFGELKNWANVNSSRDKARKNEEAGIDQEKAEKLQRGPKKSGAAGWSDAWQNLKDIASGEGFKKKPAKPKE